MAHVSSSLRVAVRVRPLIGRNEQGDPMVATHANRVVLTTGEEFAFDYVFGTRAVQDEVFRRCAEHLVDQCLEGYNVTLLAYGQTASGKTFTMGTDAAAFSLPHDELGIIPRFVDDLFAKLEKLPSTIRTEIRATFLELYNENILDLLDRSPVKNRKPHAIREDTKGIRVTNLKEIPISSYDDVVGVLHQGTGMRTTGSTLMNDASSRSHAILALNIHTTITTYSSNPDDPPYVEHRYSKVNFVDLAGSESIKKTGASGATMKEGIHINLGLHHLGVVIRTLGTPAASPMHIDYRSSKLTRLLQDSLGGSSLTLFIACVSPALFNLSETKNTLQYASCARRIENKAVINRDPLSEQISHLRSMIGILQCELVNSVLGKQLSPATLLEDAEAGKYLEALFAQHHVSSPALLAPPASPREVRFQPHVQRQALGQRGRKHAKESGKAPEGGEEQQEGSDEGDEGQEGEEEEEEEKGKGISAALQLLGRSLSEPMLGRHRQLDEEELPESESEGESDGGERQTRRELVDLMLAQHDRDTQHNRAQRSLMINLSQLDEQINAKQGLLQQVHESARKSEQVAELIDENEKLRSQLEVLEHERDELRSKIDALEDEDEAESLEGLLQDVEQRLDLMQRELSAKEQLLRLTQRKALQATKLGQDIARLKAEREKLAAEYHDKDVQHQMYIQLKNHEILKLRQAATDAKRKWDEARQSREKENKQVVTFLHRLVEDIAAKLRDTEAELLRVLEERRTTRKAAHREATRATLHKTVRKSFPIEDVKDAQEAQIISHKKFLLQQEVDKRVHCEAAEARLVQALKQRYELLQRMAGTIKEVSQASRALKAHRDEKPASESAEYEEWEARESELVEAKNALVRSVQVLEKEVSLRDDEIRDANAVIEARKQAEAEEDARGDVDMVLSSVDLHDAKQLLQSLIDGLVKSQTEVHHLTQFLSEAQDQVVQAEEQRDQAHDRMRDFAYESEMRVDSVQSEYEAHLLQLIDAWLAEEGKQGNLSAGGNDDAEQGGSIVMLGRLRNQHESLQAQNAQLRSTVEEQTAEIAQLRRELEEARLAERVPPPALRVSADIEQLENLWKEAGYDTQEQQALATALWEKIHAVCESEREGLAKFVSASEHTIKQVCEDIRAMWLCVQGSQPPVLQSVPAPKDVAKVRALYDERARVAGEVHERLQRALVLKERAESLQHELGVAPAQLPAALKGLLSLPLDTQVKLMSLHTAPHSPQASVEHVSEEAMWEVRREGLNKLPALVVSDASLETYGDAVGELEVVVANRLLEVEELASKIAALSTSLDIDDPRAFHAYMREVGGDALWEQVVRDAGVRMVCSPSIVAALWKDIKQLGTCSDTSLDALCHLRVMHRVLDEVEERRTTEIATLRTVLSDYCLALEKVPQFSEATHITKKRKRFEQKCALIPRCSLRLASHVVEELRRVQALVKEAAASSVNELQANWDELQTPTDTRRALWEEANTAAFGECSPDPSPATLLLPFTSAMTTAPAPTLPGVLVPTGEAITSMFLTPAILRALLPTVLAVREKVRRFRAINAMMAEVVEMDQQMQQVQRDAMNPERLFQRDASRKLVEEERFRGRVALKYPSLLERLREEVTQWDASEAEPFEYLNQPLLPRLQSSALNPTKLTLMSLFLPEANVSFPSPASPEPEPRLRHTDSLQVPGGEGGGRARLRRGSNDSAGGSDRLLRRGSGDVRPGPLDARRRESASSGAGSRRASASEEEGRRGSQSTAPGVRPRSRSPHNAHRQSPHAGMSHRRSVEEPAAVPRGRQAHGREGEEGRQPHARVVRSSKSPVRTPGQGGGGSGGGASRPRGRRSPTPKE